VLVVDRKGSSGVTLYSPRRHPPFLLFPLCPICLLSVIAQIAFSTISTAAVLSPLVGLLE
jgi:hypothetical protein